MTDLLTLLTTDVVAELPALLASPNIWESANITESTRMERLATPWRDGSQIFLQRFLPTDVYPLHGHAWPQAGLIVGGEIEMGVVTSKGPYPYPPLDELAAVTYLRFNSKYTMYYKESKHYMRATKGPCLGILLVGPAWEGHSEVPLTPLTPEAKETVLNEFRDVFEYNG